jgi:hypothetical protein
MSDLRKQERIAIEAVARHFSATWEMPSDSSGIYLTVAGRRVAVGVVTLKRHGACQADTPKIRLRFDRVAMRLIESLNTALGKAVPGGTTAIVTVTAPVRMASKTAAELEERIQTLLSRRLPSRDEKATIYGNRIRIRFVRDGSVHVPRVIGFVHNPETDPLLLLNVASELLDLAKARARGRVVESAADCWLVVISARGSSCLEVYRHVFSHLRLSAKFKRVLMVFADGRVGELS